MKYIGQMIELITNKYFSIGLLSLILGAISLSSATTVIAEEIEQRNGTLALVKKTIKSGLFLSAGLKVIGILFILHSIGII